jgi:molybdopterin synthase sulfur carrier subunit
MKVKVKFFATFRELFGEEVEIELRSGANIQDLLNLLCNSRKRRQTVFDDSGKVRYFIGILKRGRHIQVLDGTHTELKDGDVVTMLPPLGGG